MLVFLHTHAMGKSDGISVLVHDVISCVPLAWRRKLTSAVTQIYVVHVAVQNFIKLQLPIIYDSLMFHEFAFQLC